MSNAALIQDVKEALLSCFPDAEIEIVDDSEAHRGHPGNPGTAHLHLVIKSRAFEGLSRIEQHRLVYQTLSPFMENRIHALQIHTQTLRKKHDNLS